MKSQLATAHLVVTLATLAKLVSQLLVLPVELCFAPGGLLHLLLELLDDALGLDKHLLVPL